MRKPSGGPPVNLMFVVVDNYEDPRGISECDSRDVPLPFLGTLGIIDENKVVGLEENVSHSV
jgi:hypothetical protein